MGGMKRDDGPQVSESRAGTAILRDDESANPFRDKKAALRFLRQMRDKPAKRDFIELVEHDPTIEIKLDPWLEDATALGIKLWERLSGLRRRGRLQRPPGYGLLWFADFFYSRKSVEECLRPTIQDLQDEYAEALAAKRPHKARWVRIRGTWSFVCAAGLLTMASIGKQVVKIWKAVG
jgi:hypothetical protein